MDDWNVDVWKMNDECCMNKKHGRKNSWTNGKCDETQIMFDEFPMNGHLGWIDEWM
jgi:hypothetical protein